MVLEFEVVLEDRNLIHLPDEIAARLSRGEAVRVSITPVESPDEKMTPEAAWNATLAFVKERMAKGSLPGKASWHREDLYDHLKKYDSDRAD